MHDIAQSFGPAAGPLPAPPDRPGLQVFYEAIPWDRIETRDEESREVLRDFGIDERDGSCFLLSWWAAEAGLGVVASGRTHVLATVARERGALRDVAAFAAWHLALRAVGDRPANPPDRRN